MASFRCFASLFLCLKKYMMPMGYKSCYCKFVIMFLYHMLMQIITLQLVVDYNDQKNIPGLREWIESVNKETDRVRSDVNLFLQNQNRMIKPYLCACSTELLVPFALFISGIASKGRMGIKTCTCLLFSQKYLADSTTYLASRSK